MLTGLNSGTAQKIQLGAGAILKSRFTNGTRLTAENVLSSTNGGITVNIVPQFFTPAVDGASDNVKDLKFVTGYAVTVSFTAVEADASVITRALGVADLASGVIKGRHQIKSTDYVDLFVIGEKGNGDILQITIKNALSTGGFNLSTVNNGNGGIAFTIAGHYSLDDLDTPPFEIETIATATATTG